MQSAPFIDDNGMSIFLRSILFVFVYGKGGDRNE